MPAKAIEQLEVGREKTAAKLGTAMQKKEQLEHQMSRILNRDKQAERDGGLCPPNPLHTCRE